MMNFKIRIVILLKNDNWQNNIKTFQMTQIIFFLKDEIIDSRLMYLSLQNINLDDISLVRYQDQRIISILPFQACKTQYLQPSI